MGSVGPRCSFDSGPGGHAHHQPLDSASSAHRKPAAVSTHGHLRKLPLSSTQQPQGVDTLSSHPAVSHSQYPYEGQSSSTYRDIRHPVHPVPYPNQASARVRSRSATRTQGGNPQGATGFSSQGQSVPSPHRHAGVRPVGQEAYLYSIPPGADKLSEAAAGGIPGLAMSVAEQHAREGGLAANGNAQPYHHQPSSLSPPHQRAQSQTRAPPDARLPGNDPAGGRSPYQQGRGTPPYQHGRGTPPYQNSRGTSPYMTALPTDPALTRSFNSFHNDPFVDPQMAYGQRMDPRLGQVNPNDIDDDGDDGLEYGRSTRNSLLSLGNSSNRGVNGASAPAAGATTAASVFGGLIGKGRNSGSDSTQTQPAAVAPGDAAIDYEFGPPAEKSAWIQKQSNSRKKWKWIIVSLVLLIIAGVVVGGVLGTHSVRNGKSAQSGVTGGGGGGQSAGDDTAQNGDLNINSSEIQALLHNPNLHKVFPGVDYTPINSQYPDCLTNPPSQNNVTRDVAVLSQLTNVIRLYGTDCNQTEMTIHAVKQLKLEDEIKIWLGVWQDNNQTTNARQLDQMWRILDQYGDSPFAGLIVGNEILFRKQMTTQQLGDLLNSVRSNLTEHNWSLPVATSDLGDNWDAELAQYSDCIMGNVHPFFGGIDSKQAAAWANSFWTTKAGSFFKSDPKKNIISEIGWPSQGGTDCGGAASCTSGATAGIDELNTLLETWVCQSLQNGTNYFWFEMFDEPWKISFDTPGEEWEDHWGIMDVNRNLKPGVKIPDCGGMTV